MPFSESQKRLRDIECAKAEISSLVTQCLADLVHKRIRSIFGTSSNVNEAISNDECQAFIDQFVLHRLTPDETTALVRAGRQNIATRLIERPVKIELDRLLRLNQMGRRDYAVQSRSFLHEQPKKMHSMTSPSSTSSRHETGISRGLIIREGPLEDILSGRKTWEMRKQHRNILGAIALIRKGSKAIFGVANIVDSRGPFSLDEMVANEAHHLISPSRLNHLDFAEYRYAWVLSRALRLTIPIPYEHKRGAQSNVILDERAIRDLNLALRFR